MIVVTSSQVAGKRIVRTLGLVRGNTIRARHVGKDIMAASSRPNQPLNLFILSIVLPPVESICEQFYPDIVHLQPWARKGYLSARRQRLQPRATPQTAGRKAPAGDVENKLMFATYRFNYFFIRSSLLLAVLAMTGCAMPCRGSC